MNKKMIGMLTFICLSFVLFLPAGMAVTDAAKDSTTAVYWLGIMRNDGILLPFVQFDKIKWQNAWFYEDTQYSSDNNPVIKKLRDIPGLWLGQDKKLPESWMLYSPDGVTKEVKTRGVKLFDTHCSQFYGLTTDISNKTETPSKKLGICVSPDIKIDPAKNVDVQDDNYEQIHKYVLEIYNDIENTTVERLLKAGGSIITEDEIPKSRKAREAIKPVICEIKALVPDVYFFYIYRGYKKYPSGYYGRAVALCGWAKMDVTGKYKLIESSSIIGEGGPDSGVFYYKVFGSLQAGDRIYYIVERNYYEWEDYFIFEIKDNKFVPVLEFDGGGC